MIDTKFTEIHKNGEVWRDGGHVKVGFDRVLRTQPELIKDEELARVIGDVIGRRKGALAITGVTSSGLLTLSEERAREVDGFEVFDFRLMHGERYLDRCIDRSTIFQGRDEEGVYLSFEVPANATIDTVNRWLVANYPDYTLDVEVTTKISSGIGANILTGLLGENRRPVEADGLTVIVGSKVENVLGKDEVDAYRGTQGYAGIVKKVRVKARKTPVMPSMLLLPLRGTEIESSFATSYAAALAHLAPWIYSEVDGTRISAADILDLTGLQTIHRVEHDGDMSGFHVPAFLSEQIDAEHHAMICMRLEGPNSAAGNDDLITTISELSDKGLIGNIKLLEKTPDITPVVARRGQVPERAREEAENPNYYSTSMDIDVKILFDSKEVDLRDESNRLAYEAAYKEVIRSYRPLEELQAHGVYLTWNGHFYMTNTPYYYTGGHNPHPRVTAPLERKGEMVAAKNTVTKSLIALHGKKFGPFTICVQEGEKHYPHDALTQAHFAADQPRWARERASLTARAGILHNARVPTAYAATMRTAGFPLE